MPNFHSAVLKSECEKQNEKGEKHLIICIENKLEQHAASAKCITIIDIFHAGAVQVQIINAQNVLKCVMIQLRFLLL